MKNNLEYFRHDAASSEHEKFLALRARFGWAGEGRFWALNGAIARSEHCRLDLNRKFLRPSIAQKLDLSLDELEEFLVYLRDECDLIQYEKGYVTTKRTQADLDSVMPIREYSQKRRKGSGARSADELKTSADELKTSADRSDEGKQSREKKREEEQREEKKAAARANELPEDQDSAFAAYCLDVARSRNARNPEAMARKLATEVDVQKAFLLSKAPAPEESKPTRIAPPPPPCDCGSPIRASGYLGEGKCTQCGQFWEYDWDWTAWAKTKPIPVAGAG